MRDVINDSGVKLLWIMGLFSLQLMLSACQAEAVVALVDPEEEVVASPGKPLNPVLVSTVAAPAANPALLLPTPKPTSTQAPSPITTVMAEETTVAISPTSSPTPLPTYTPPALPFTSNDEHYWFWRPVPEGSVVWTDKTYPYGSTRGGELRAHHGVEFNVPYNTPVLAVASGTVVFAGSDESVVLGESTHFYGNVVVIQHDSIWLEQPIYTLYGHMNEVAVSVGDWVDVRYPLGLSGATGVADGPHLHFEVRVGENTYDATRNPLLWIYPFEGRGTVAGRIEWPDGTAAESVPVTLHRLDAPTSQYYQTVTYSGDSVNGDDRLFENFAIDDVVAGYYEIVVGEGENKIKREVWVFEYHTTFERMELVPAPEDSNGTSDEESSEGES